MGHYTNECPEKKSEPGIKSNSFQKGHVNHMDVEEVMEAPDLVIGKFLVNSDLALVFFDSGASHSIISRAYLNKHRLPTKTLDKPIRVSSPGGEMLKFQELAPLP